MNIYSSIRFDHEHHRDLIQTLLDTEGDSARRRDFWSQFYYDVKSHAAAEEECFYAEMMGHPKGQDRARHSVAEHKELDDLMEELNGIEFSSPQWLQKFKHLADEYIHHIEEEEDEIFERAQSIFDGSESKQMAELFKHRKSEERKLIKEKSENKLKV